MLPPCEPIALPATTTDVQMLTGACLIQGWSFYETTNAAGASFELYDGTSAGGDFISGITLVANESTRDLIPAPGLEVETGLFFHRMTGTIKGAIWVVLAGRYELPDVQLTRTAWWGRYVFG